MLDLYTVSEFPSGHGGLNSVMSKYALPEWKPRNRCDHSSADVSAFHQLAKPLFDEYTMMWLKLVWE